MTTESKPINVGQTKMPSAPKRRTRAANFTLLRQLWPWAFLILLLLSFGIYSKVVNDVNFFSMRSVMGILVYASQILLIGLGETLVMVAAGIDLSAGWVLGFSSIIAASIMRDLNAAGYGPVATVGLGFLAGILVAIVPGLINGILVTRIKVPAFIATLGMGFLVQGISLVITAGQTVTNQPDYLGPLGNNSLVYIWPGHPLSWFKMPDAATGADLPNITAFLPGVVVVTVIVTTIVWFILSRTQFGQHLYAIGGNYEASLRAGISVRMTLVKAYVLAAVLAGIGGVLWAARFTGGAYNAGEVTTFQAIAAVVIGGTSMFGGEGTIIGTIIGTLCIATIQYGLVLVGVLAFWQYVAIGIVVIMAVIVDQFGRTLGR
jgi:ribose transport system permease protein